MPRGVAPRAARNRSTGPVTRGVAPRGSTSRQRANQQRLEDLGLLEPGKGGGILGTLRRIPGDFLHGAKQAAVNAPGGIYSAGKAGFLDVKENPLYSVLPLIPILAAQQKARGKSSHVERELIRPMATGIKQTVEHPLRDPFQTFTLGAAVINPALGAGLRTTAGLRAISAAGGVGRTKAFVGAATAKVAPVRVLIYDSPTGSRTEVTVPAFKTPLGRLAQRQMDKARALFPEGTATVLGKELPVGRIFSPVHGSQHAKVKFEQLKNKDISLAHAESVGAEIEFLGRKLKPHEQVAMYVALIGRNPGKGGNVTLQDHINAHQRWIDNEVGSKVGHERWIQWLTDAKPLLTETGGGPKIRKEHVQLKQLHDKMLRASTHRQELWENLGVLNPVDSKARNAATGQMIKYDKILRDEPEGQLALAEPAEATVVSVPVPKVTLPKATALRNELEVIAGGELRDVLDNWSAVTTEQADLLADYLRTELGSGGMLSIEKAQDAGQSLGKERADARRVLKTIESKTVEPSTKNLKAGERAVDYADIIEDPFWGGVRVAEMGSKRKKGKKPEKGFIPEESSKQHVPSTLTHEYEAELLRQGTLQPHFSHYMAESISEAERFASLIRGRKDLEQAAKAVQTSKHDVLVNLGALDEADSRYQVIFQKLENDVKLDAQETASLGLVYEWYRQKVFGKEADAWEMTPQGLLELKPGWGYIDKRDLGDLHKPSIFVTRGGLRTATSALGTALDVANDASRLAFIYLKFGYIPANMLGNLAMVLIHQGVFAPGNLLESWKVTSKMARTQTGPGNFASIDRIMGLGITSLARGSTSATRRATTAYAGFAAKFIDIVPRRSAFLHEARRAGFDSPKKIDDLLHHPKHADELVNVTRQAREWIGDYERLGGMEKHIIRRIIFFYPWLKVSTRMTGRHLVERPISAAVMAQLGEIGKAEQLEFFGLPEMPAGYEGLIPLGGGMVGDPRAVGIWSTPAEIGEAGLSLFPGGPSVTSNLIPSSYATPPIGALLQAVTGTNAFGEPSGKSALEAMTLEQFQSIPTIRALRRSFESDEQRGRHVYPQTARDAWLQWLTSIYRGPVNRGVLADILERDKQGR